jgi:translation initiation factor 1
VPDYSKLAIAVFNGFLSFRQAKINMSKKNKKITGDIVYSTNPDFEFEMAGTEKSETLSPRRQDLKVWLDRRQRKGKVVTQVTGFVGSEDDLKSLAKFLKTKCGTGGTAKDNEIFIQGDLREKVIEILIQEGYRAKKAGG